MVEKRNQARELDQKGAGKKSRSESGGRLGHQKSQGSKQKKLHNAAKNTERRIKALGEVTAPEAVRNVQFRQSKALELHNPFPIAGHDICKRFEDKVIFDHVSFQFPLGGKIAIRGANSAGKTTLFNMIRDRESGITLSPKAEMATLSKPDTSSNGIRTSWHSCRKTVNTWVRTFERYSHPWGSRSRMFAKSCRY